MLVLDTSFACILQVLAKLEQFKSSIASKHVEPLGKSEGGIGEDLSDWKSVRLKFAPDPKKVIPSNLHLPCLTTKFVFFFSSKHKLSFRHVKLRKQVSFKRIWNNLMYFSLESKLQCRFLGKLISKLSAVLPRTVVASRNC